MNILVTGGCGFIGYHLVKHLVDGNHVTVVDNISEFNPRYVSDACYRIFDIKDVNCHRHLANEKFDVIYHLAAVSTISDSFKDPQKTMDVNVGGTIALLEKAKRDGSEFIFASTCAIYGEDFSPYALSKSFGETLCTRYKENFKLKTTIFRISNVYGERDQKGILYKIEKAAREMGTINLIGDGDNFRNYVHVEDVVSALTSDNRGGVFDIATEDFYTLNDLINGIIEVRTKKTKMELGHDYSIVPETQKNIVKNWVPRHKLIDYITQINQRIDDMNVPF